jgi:glycine/D-amino acid oxidase-like deaminating enzyme
MDNQIDVLVVGGGMAGCAAAIAATREGASVVLLESHTYLGGNATRAMVQPWQSFHAAAIQPDGSLPRQVIGGIAQEYVDDLIAAGASPGHIVDPIGFAGSITPVDTEFLKLYLYRKLTSAGVDVHLDTPATREWLERARQIVDATGNAAAARMLGAQVVAPDEAQPMSWLFSMAPVEYREIRRYQNENPDEFVMHPGYAKFNTRYLAVSGFFSLVKHAREAGELNIPRDRLLFFSTPRPAEVTINTTRIPADHPEPRNEGLRQILELSGWLAANVPGFGKARISRLADDIGQRESFRLDGKYTLLVDDIVEGRTFPDAVAVGCYPVDIHSANSSELLTRKVGGRGYYQIPMRCMESPQVENLLCAGRCISADRYGFASARVLPTAIATGQAAGILAVCRLLRKKVDNYTCLSTISLV